MGKNEKRYFLIVSDGECVTECWANSYKDLTAITHICDEKEKPYEVSMIVDVHARQIYEV